MIRKSPRARVQKQFRFALNMTDFFDQPYFRVNKVLLLLLGAWPEQTRLQRYLLPSLYVAVVASIAIPEIIRIMEIRHDRGHVLQCLPPLLAMAGCLTKLFNCSINTKKIYHILKRIQAHWTEMKSSPNVEILHKYGQRGRLITISYTIFIYCCVITYLLAPMMPIIFDMVIPLNESRKRNFLYDAEYGVDQNDYFYEILFHAFVTTVATMMILTAADCLYFIIIEHACGLFEMVGATIQTIKKTPETSVIADYKKICYCIDLHIEALEFVALIESAYTVVFVLMIVIGLITMSVSALTCVLNLGNHEEMVRFGIFVAGQVIHLFFISLPGQKIQDQSLRVQEAIYASDWVDFHVRNRRLVLIIMMRSYIPCRLTAGKIYIITLESFSAAMQTAMSYFTVLLSTL